MQTPLGGPLFCLLQGYGTISYRKQGSVPRVLCMKKRGLQALGSAGTTVTPSVVTNSESLFPKQYNRHQNASSDNSTLQSIA